MVHDHIKYAPAYFTLSPGIRTALTFLQQADIGSLPLGRLDVDGDEVFALVSEYDTRRPEETFWEAHRRHVDVQFVHRGRERIAYGDLAAFDCDPYDEQRDLIVARGAGSGAVEVAAAGFVILFPHDVHMPGLVASEVERVRKVVMKVRVG